MNRVYIMLLFDWQNRMSAWKSSRGSSRKVSLFCLEDEDELMAEGQLFAVRQNKRTKASYQSILLPQQGLDFV